MKKEVRNYELNSNTNFYSSGFLLQCLTLWEQDREYTHEDCILSVLFCGGDFHRSRLFSQGRHTTCLQEFVRELKKDTWQMGHLGKMRL